MTCNASKPQLSTFNPHDNNNNKKNNNNLNNRKNTFKTFESSLKIMQNWRGAPRQYLCNKTKKKNSFYFK